MDKTYIKTRDLDYYQQMKIDNVMHELGLDMQDFISIDQLINMLCDLYVNYYNLKKNYDVFINFIDGKRSK